LRFVYLAITPDAAAQRVAARAGTHFFHGSLVASQFEALEPPLDEARVLRLDATLSTALLQIEVALWLHGQPSEVRR